MTENKNKVGFYVNIDYKQPWARNGNKQADMNKGTIAHRDKEKIKEQHLTN